MIGMLRDARLVSYRFWQAYAVALLAVGVGTLSAAEYGWSLFVAIVLVVVGWIVFMALMVAYRLGMIRAYGDAHQWAVEAREAVRHMGVTPDKLGEFAATHKGFEGPS